MKLSIFLSSLTVSCSLLSAFAGSAVAAEHNVGFKRIQLDDPMGGSMQVSLWYPTDEKVGPLNLGPFSFEAKRNAKPKPGKRSLVVMSHGTGGSDLGHRNVALEMAKRGLVVAAPLHPRNNFRDDSDLGTGIVLEGRPRQISAIITALINDKSHGFDVNQRHVGGFGFSLGGYTMLALMGAKPAPRQIAINCQAYENDPACLLIKQLRSKGVSFSKMDSSELADSRLCAAVIADPFTGPFSDDALRSVKTRFVQIWKPAFENVLLAKAHIDRVIANLNDRGTMEETEVISVPLAQHYSFLAPFPKSISYGLPPELINDHDDFDRTKFQERFAKEVANFLATSLNKCSSD